MDDLTQAALQAALGPRPFRFFEQIGSTNDHAREWLTQGASTGACVIADQQVSGRGRMGRAWQTPPRSALALSVVLRPTAQALPYITMLGALAVAQTAQQFGADAVGIKWPNDVLLMGRKVCGILAEADWQQQTLRGVILGIGVNVRVDFHDTPLHDTAISLEDALHTRIDRTALLVALLDRIDAGAGLLARDAHALYAAWRGHLVTLGQQVSITYGATTYTGRAVDALPDGALVIESADGTRHTVYAGDVSA